MTITHPTRRLVDSVELRSLWPVGRTTFYKTIKSPNPMPVQLVNGGDYLWYLGEVAAWLETRRRRPGGYTRMAEPAALPLSGPPMRPARPERGRSRVEPAPPAGASS